MRCNEFRQGIGPLSSRAHVIVVETLDFTDLRQMPFPILHPRMRRRGTRPWSKKNQPAAHWSFSQKLLIPRPLSLQSRSGIPDLPEPRRRSTYLPADSEEKRFLLK